MAWFIVRFTLIALLSYGLIYLPTVREHVIEPFTIGITELSGFVIGLFGGTATVFDNYLSVPGFSVQVLDLCNGVEATIILFSAVLAYSAPMIYRLKGLLFGFFCVHALNIVRIISLVYLGAHKPEWFQWVHWFLWDALIMIDILVAFMVWLHYMPGRSQGNAVPA